MGLDWREHVESDPMLLCLTDLLVGQANPTKARERLGRTASSKMKDVVRRMVSANHTLYSGNERGVFVEGREHGEKLGRGN